MSGRLLLLKVTEITGDSKAEGYTDQIVLDAASFGATSIVQAESNTGTVSQASLQCSVTFGPWVADIQQALFHGKDLGEVTLTELEQQADPTNKKVWKKVREVKLTDAFFEAMSHSWSGINTSVSFAINFVNIVYNWGDKVAHYNTDETT